MTPSGYGAAESWAASESLAAPESWAADEGLAASESWGADESWEPSATPAGIQYEPVDEEQPAADWERSSAFETASGLSGRGVIALSALVVGGCAVLDLLLTGGRITFFFDLCFVVVCLVATMAVRRSDLFTAGVLPPLLFAGVVAVLALAAPHAFESGPGLSRVFLTGLADHAAGLVFGYAVALAAVAGRVATAKSQ